ncbi:aspartate dehydrogenase domain-containing protein [Marinibacterium sp. SX1]|uniref:aspartate dehydrogenase domain-containing protein n=1 Tax=Marinibacterium sp. SX1 TaxID=3388424 RepID=UPI003D182B6A
MKAPAGPRDLVVAVIGHGRIGRQVLAHLDAAPGLIPGRVLTRSGRPDTGDADDFLSTPCDLILDTAGPGALRAHGAACLAHAPVWSVGAAALVDDSLRDRLAGVARTHGHGLRLFGPWVAGVAQVPPGLATGLVLRISRPGSGAEFAGPLRAAAAAFPDELNFAVAAALCGPGLEATRVEMTDGPEHRIEARLDTRIGCFTSTMAFAPGGLHPTAQALIAGLEALHPGIGYGA